MNKFDISCGLTKKEIDIIKYAVKDEISRQLPIFPELIEAKLFLQGRDAWIYSWELHEKHANKLNDSISLGVVVKLKREFHEYNECKHYKFSCRVWPGLDVYQPKISVIQESPNYPSR